MTCQVKNGIPITQVTIIGVVKTIPKVVNNSGIVDKVKVKMVDNNHGVVKEVREANNSGVVRVINKMVASNKEEASKVKMAKDLTLKEVKLLHNLHKVRIKMVNNSGVARVVNKMK